MKVKLFVASLFFAIFCSQCGSHKEVQFSGEIDNHLAKHITRALANAQMMTVYQLDPQSTPDTNQLGINQYRALKERSFQQSTEVNKVLNVLSRNDFYRFGTDVNMCLFTPEIGARFFSDAGTVEVLISQRCQEIRFVDPAQAQTTILELSSTALSQLAEINISELMEKGFTL